MDIQGYLTHKQYFEAGMWSSWFLIIAASNSVIRTLDLQRVGEVFQWWEPYVWEYSSAALTLSLLPLILLVDRHFPMRRAQLIRHAAMHLGCTVVFSVLHVAGMVLIRKLTYSAAGSQYDFGHWPTEFGYEYLKDVQTYAAILSVIYLYRFILLRLRGEASLPDNEEQSLLASDRFLIKKLGKEFLIRIDDIDWLEASGNYVNLHAHGRVYPMRQTMQNMTTRLQDKGFARIHRSAIVNLDRIAHIEPLETGDAQAHLTSGTIIPVSRRYRSTLKENFA